VTWTYHRINEQATGRARELSIAPMMGWLVFANFL
jgi:hypothetical protein